MPVKAFIKDGNKNRLREQDIPQDRRYLYPVSR